MGSTNRSSQQTRLVFTIEKHRTHQQCEELWRIGMISPSCPWGHAARRMPKWKWKWTWIHQRYWAVSMVDHSRCVEQKKEGVLLTSINTLDMDALLRLLSSLVAKVPSKLLGVSPLVTGHGRVRPRVEPWHTVRVVSRGRSLVELPWKAETQTHPRVHHRNRCAGPPLSTTVHHGVFH